MRGQRASRVARRVAVLLGVLSLAAFAAACSSGAKSASANGLAVLGFRQSACPAGGSTRQVFARPRLARPGEIGDVEPGKTLGGWKIVRGVDLDLPSGRLLETGGEYLGADGKPVDLGVKPGRYPWFLILARYPFKKTFWFNPTFAQLVLDPSRRPVRWEDDRRFGFVTDGGMGFIGSPEVAPRLSVLEANFASTFGRLIDRLRTSPCVAYQDEAGENFVVYQNGFGDGPFPGSAGFDRTGKLVAITWLLAPEPWILGGIPGTPPESIRAMTACRRRLIAQRVGRQESVGRCAKIVGG